MARNESDHALPAWLQDEPEARSAPVTPRRGLRRSAARVRKDGTAEPAPHTGSGADSVPTTATSRSAAPSQPVGGAAVLPAPASAPPIASTPASITPPASVPFSMIPLERDPEPHVPVAPEPVAVVPEPVAVVQAPEGLPEPAPDLEPSPESCPEPVPDTEPVPDPEAATVPGPEAATVPEPVSEVVPLPGSERGPATEPIEVPAPVHEPAAPVETHDVDVMRDQVPRVTTAPDHQPSNLDLASGVLVRRSRRAPSRGWRRGVHRLTGGLFDPGMSSEDADHDDLVARIRQPISGDYRIAVLSLKGGVGKTTTTVGLGSTFASMRGDCVIAVDANPDFGTLAQRVPEQTQSTVRDLIAVADRIERYSDVRAHTSQAPSRLEVLASERDPAVSEAFSEDDYRRVIDVLQVYYNIILTDCGTGIMHSAMGGVLDLANALVLVGSPAVDGARSAAATLDWLEHHGYSDLVDRTVVVISSPRPGNSSIDLDALTEHFLARCRAVQVVPFDEHLAEGAEIDLNLLRPTTRRAFAELAAMVADDFPRLTGRHAVQW
ncbi:AAA family ATPase [Rhodococcus sp. HNM0563]|uniref:nucleotide-binding protein n=1 Tax=Rhodococcus sp. HNM0563 TaxID=2716339 RepID=UPI001F0DB015|nr:AAA family ATPase [Rhodococcus sp. HNM0563]